jgi:hypothetical protein
MSPPVDAGRLSSRCSRERHCDLGGIPPPLGSRFPILRFVHFTTTFLLPLAPPRFTARLHRYYESSDFCRAALLDVRYRRVRSHPTGDTRRGPGPLIEQCPLLLKLTIRHASCTRQFSLLIAFDLPTIPSPTTALPFRHGHFHTLLQRRDLPCLSPGQTSKVGGNAVARSRVRTSPGASPTGLAELSSHTLRTGRSSQVALHPSSRKMQLPLSTTGW